MSKYNEAAVIQFFDDKIRNGAINPETGKTLKNSVLRGVRLLTQEQQKDLSKITFEHVEKLLDEHYKGKFDDPSTIYTYKTRFRRGFKYFQDGIKNLAPHEAQQDAVNSEENEEDEKRYNEVASQIIPLLSKLKPTQISRLIKLLNAYY